ncbi:unnamed protein product [Discula destructiva]
MNRLLSAPDPLVHSILVALCDDERIQARALKHLAALKDYANKLDGTSAADGEEPHHHHHHHRGVVVVSPEPASSNPRKRKTTASMMPAQLCVMCKAAFSPCDNSPTACRCHQGQLMLDEAHEVWADWDASVSGPQASPDNEEDYPQGFIWSCCDEDGTKPGCTKAYHLAVRQDSSKRFRISSPPGPEPDRNRIFEGRVLKANEFVNETLGPNQSAWGPSSTVRACESETDDSGSMYRQSRAASLESEGQGMKSM